MARFMTNRCIPQYDQRAGLREEAERGMDPYRGRMQPAQVEQVTQQFMRKRMLEARRLPRLSLFYMPQEG
jgi:hypothetical protein